MQTKTHYFMVCHFDSGMPRLVIILHWAISFYGLLDFRPPHFLFNQKTGCQVLLTTHLHMQACGNFRRSSVASAVQRSCGPESSDRILIVRKTFKLALCLLGGRAAKILLLPSPSLSRLYHPCRSGFNQRSRNTRLFFLLF